MSKELVFAERQLRYWENRVRRLRQTSDASDAKETEAEIRDLPPTPPIENKGEEKEKDEDEVNTPVARACACARVRARPEERSRPIEEELHDIHTPPSLETAICFGKQHFIDETIVREWYTYQNEVSFWLDDTTGKPIKNWRILLVGWKNFKKRMQKFDNIDKAKQKFYEGRSQQTANNQPEGVVLKRKDYNVRF